MNINFIFLFLALIAEIIGTIGGFGSSVFFVPIGNFYFDFQSVLGLTGIFHLASNASKIALFKQGLDKRLLFYIGLPSVIFVILGGLWANVLNGHYLEIALGIFLIGLSAIFLIKKNLIFQASNKNAITGGVLSGFSAGLLGTGGAIRGLTMAAFNLEKSAFVATSAFIDFMIDLTRSVVYFKNGFVHEHDMYYLPFLIVIAIIGTYLGKLILKKIPQEKFKQLSLILILLIGIVSLFKTVLTHN